mgnify:CR=1 FL=1
MTTEIFLMEDVNAQAQSNRDYDYQKVIHPMLVQLQLGKITQQDLQNAVAEIDAKYPFVTEDLVIKLDKNTSINIG